MRTSGSPSLSTVASAIAVGSLISDASAALSHSPKQGDWLRYLFEVTVH